MQMDQWKRYAAEFLGTFVLVFMGTASVVGAVRFGVNPLLVAPFAFGLALLAGLYAFSEVSGGHFNPAVSLGLYLDGRLSSTDLVAYWVSQFLGGIFAALILLLATTSDDVASAATVPSSDGTALVLEIVMTAIFVCVILQASKSVVYGESALLAIPLTLLAVHFAAIPFSGSSVNPARTFGPDLIGNRWTGIWIYFIGPAIGAVIAWAVHTFVVASEAEVREDMGGLHPTS
jgi:aquaporin Z